MLKAKVKIRRELLTILRQNLIIYRFLPRKLICDPRCLDKILAS